MTLSGRRVSLLPAGTIEQQLVADGLQPELKAILLALGYAQAASLTDDALVKQLEVCKVNYASELSRRVGTDPALAQRMPECLRKAVMSMKGLT